MFVRIAKGVDRALFRVTSNVALRMVRIVREPVGRAKTRRHRTVADDSIILAA